MFKVNNLSKTFKTNGNVIKALDGVSFDLPSKGLIFVTGKSGTGKSTLLNLLGGLSKIDSGEIYFNNIKLNELSEKQLSYYRNEYIGFMFQDFNIFDDLTVYQNIELALTIKGTDDKEKIEQEIDTFELTSFINQKVNRLSVGQKERVALLRALIKDPKVLLCDEPTGNLDTLTADIILKRLKDESRKRLVVVITHNLTEAYKYASRIIKLNDGKIVEDISFPFLEHEALIKDKTIYLNDLRNLNESIHYEIKNKIKKHEIDSLNSVSKLFVPTDKIYYEVQEITLKEKNMKKKRIFSFHFSLFKKEILRSLIYLFLGVISLSIFSVCLMYYKFDTTAYLKTKLDSYDIKSYNIVNFGKGENGELLMREIDEIPEDEKTNVSKGKYFLSNTSFTLGNGYDNLKNGKYTGFSQNFANFYSYETSGTIYGIDQKFLNDTFCLDDVEVVELAPYKKEGIYITDYIYDSMLFNKVNVKNLGGYFYNFNDSKHPIAYINGLIKTDYYNYFKNKYNIAPDNFNVTHETNYDLYFEIIHRVCSFYNATYSFEKDFLDTYINSDLLGHITFVGLDSDFGRNVLRSEHQISVELKDDGSQDNVLYVSRNKVNSLMNKKLSLEEWKALVKDKTIDLSYRCGLTKSFETDKVRLDFVEGDQYLVNKKLYYKIKDMALGDYGIVYSDNNSALAKTLRSHKDRYLYLLEYKCKNEDNVVNIIDVYKDFFMFIGTILLIVSVFIFVYLSYESVKRLTFNIGVLKGIGMNIKDLFFVYFINSIYLFVAETIFYFIDELIFINILNPLLRAALGSGYENVNLSTLMVFDITFLNSLTSLASLLIALTVGIIVPILKIKQIKPIDILKRV